MEECDSTWGSDSEIDDPAAEEDSGISEPASAVESEQAAGHSGDTSPQVHGAFMWVRAGFGTESVKSGQENIPSEDV